MRTKGKAAQSGGLVVCLRKVQDNWAELRFSFQLRQRSLRKTLSQDLDLAIVGNRTFATNDRRRIPLAGSARPFEGERE